MGGSYSLGKNIAIFKKFLFQLEISTPLKYSKPNEELTITVKSEQGSLILLTAVDENSDLISMENEISRNDVYNELTHYLSHKIPNSHDYKFEKVNNFVLDPLEKGINCGQKSSPYVIKSNSTQPAPWTQNYFPNIWFDKVFETKSGNFQTIKMKIPNSLKTWKIYGISVHPTKGFTVVKYQPKITIESDVAVQIRAPEMIYENETFKVDVKVINIFKNELSANVDFEIENGIFQNIKTRESCHSFESLANQIPNFRLNFNSLDKSKSESIYIKSTNAGKLKIKAVASVNGYSHEDEKVIDVNKVNLEQKSQNYFYVNWTISGYGNDQYEFKIDANAQKNQDFILEVELPRGYVYTSHNYADVGQ